MTFLASAAFTFSQKTALKIRYSFGCKSYFLRHFFFSAGINNFFGWLWFAKSCYLLPRRNRSIKFGCFLRKRMCANFACLSQLFVFCADAFWAIKTARPGSSHMLLLSGKNWAV